MQKSIKVSVEQYDRIKTMKEQGLSMNGFIKRLLDHEEQYIKLAPQ